MRITVISVIGIALAYAIAALLVYVGAAQITLGQWILGGPVTFALIWSLSILLGRKGGRD
jgi:hypothetical protein